MKSVREIGLVKIIRFVFFSFWQIIFNWMIFPPLRTWWLRLFGAKIGINTIIHNIKFNNLYHHGLNNFQVGNNCFLGPEISFDIANKIILEDNVAVGERTIFSTHINIGYRNHPLQKYFPKTSRPIFIGKGSFIGVGSIILAGTNLGECVFIPAGTTVQGKVPAWHIVNTKIKAKFIRIKN